MAASFLAVASGAAAAPLNPAYKAEEFDFYLADLEAAAVIVQAGWASPVREVAARRGIPVIELIPSLAAPAGTFDLDGSANGSWVRGPAASGEDPFSPADPADVVLILHTSGTTSRPKMVPLTGANLCASANHIR